MSTSHVTHKYIEMQIFSTNNSYKTSLYISTKRINSDSTFISRNRIINLQLTCFSIDLNKCHHGCTFNNFIGTKRLVWLTISMTFLSMRPPKVCPHETTIASSRNAPLKKKKRYSYNPEENYIICLLGWIWNNMPYIK